MKTTSFARRPAAVLNALRLLVLCLVIELLGFAFSGNYTTGSIVGILVGAVLTFYVLRQVYAGANWARLVTITLIALGVLASVSSFAANYRQHPGATVIDAFSTLISLIAAGLLFTKDSSAWFRARA